MNSDFKNNRVEDPTKVSEKQIKKVKKYCKDYFDKAVAKHRAHEQKKAGRKSKDAADKASASNSTDKAGATPTKASQLDNNVDAKDEESDVQVSDAEIDDDPEDRDSLSLGDSLKRKRTEDKDAEEDQENGILSPSKRQRSVAPAIPPPPPPTSPPNDLYPADNEPGEDLMRRETEDPDDYDDGSGDDTTTSSGKGRRSEIPPPPPPPPPPAETFPDDMEQCQSNHEAEPHDGTTKLAQNGGGSPPSPSCSPHIQQSVSIHNSAPCPAGDNEHS